MTEILKSHALANIWAEPLQDMQHRIKPNRVSPRNGFYGEAKVMWERIPLPDKDIPPHQYGFHVYPLGQLPPFKFALENMPKQTWFSAEELVVQYNTVIDLYADNGTVIPRTVYYIYQNYDNNLILAVKRNSVDLGTIKVITPYNESIDAPYSLDEHGVTIRFYNNALTHNSEWLDTAARPNEVLKDIHVTVNKAADLVSFLTQVDALKSKYNSQGDGVYYQDGFLVSRPSAYTTALNGSIFVYQYDETVKDIRFFAINQIPGFKSIIDKNKDKYLLLSATKNGVLEYRDDCDYYLVMRDELLKTYRGVMIDPYNDVAIKQVTHDAWSVTQDSCALLSGQHDFLVNLQQLTIMVKVRNGGMIRGIGLQANRVEELYHLPYVDMLEAMAGVNSTMPEWRAAELENSAYIKVMSYPINKITNALVEEAYGYNAATYAVAKSIYKVVNGQAVIDDGKNLSYDSKIPNPVAKAAKRSLFWYDSDGLLLGYSSSDSMNNVVIPPAAYSKATVVEVITGELVVGVGAVGTVSDAAKVYDDNYGFFGYRNYVCNIVNGIPDNKWSDITGSQLCPYVIPTDGTAPYVQWNHSLLDQVGYYPATRFANTCNVHLPTFKKATFGGILKYDIMRINEATINQLQVPPGFITVWMGGKSLVENLDWYYGVGGRIVIVKYPDKAIDDLAVTIRFHGYMNPTTKKPFAPRDVGFVKNGYLSVNQVFNPWHDRDIRINVGGGLKTSDQVLFAEAGSGNAGKRYLDGMVYSVEDYQSLVEPFTSMTTVDSKMVSMEIDQRVSEYLTSRLPENDPLDQYITPARHELYSPVMAYFVDQVLTGKITDAAIDLEIKDSKFLDRYKYVIDEYGIYDPVINGYDEEYVYVQPHPYLDGVEVTSNQYAFLDKVNRIFLKSKLNISLAIRIKL